MTQPPDHLDFAKYINDEYNIHHDIGIEDVAKKDWLKAWEIFKGYEDKDLSFTDCTSFVLIKNLRVQKTFTFDEHFRQMGFQIF